MMYVFYNNVNNKYVGSLVLCLRRASDWSRAAEAQAGRTGNRKTINCILSHPIRNYIVLEKIPPGDSFEKKILSTSRKLKGTLKIGVVS